VGALDQLRPASGDDGLAGRLRSNPWLLVATAGAAILILAWIGWAIRVATDDGARAGLGVLIAWPAMLLSLALVSLPFIGGYLLTRRLLEGGGGAETAEVEADEEDEEDAEDSEEHAAGDEKTQEDESEPEKEPAS
jgi:hypothetical protein